MAHTRDLLGLFALFSLSGCADGDVLADFPGDDPPGWDGGSERPPPDAGPPPEVETPLRFDTPQAGARVVYVPNPATRRVAVVDAKTFAIETVTTGSAPTYVATAPGRDLGLVINVGSMDLAVLRTENGKTTTRSLPLGHTANAIALAPDGAHAVVYFDENRSGVASPSTFQDVTVVGLAGDDAVARGVSVGFRPRSVQFSADGSTAFVVTEDGVSIIDLAAAVEAPTIARTVPVGDALADALSHDVQVSADGRYAVARREGEAGARLVDLASGDLHALTLAALGLDGPGADGAPDGGLDGGDAEAGGAITDLDLAPGGSFALAVVREAGAVLRIPVPAGFTNPEDVSVLRVDAQVVGSVAIAPTGDLAVLYTTAFDVESVLLLDLGTPGAVPRPVRLRKGVRAVALSADGTRALLLHTKQAGDPAEPGLDEERRIDRSEGYSLVDTTSGFAKLKLTDAAVRDGDLLVTPDAARMFALLRDDAHQVRGYETADLGSFQVESHTLSAPPVSLGLVPAAGRVFIGQEAEGGLISFLDAASGALVRPVAGFELTSGVRQ